MKVLEVGCGSGAYTPYAARRIGPKGQLYALDIQKKMLAQLERKLRKPAWSGIDNVRLVEANAYSIPLTDETVDLVYMITVLAEIPDQARALKEIRRVMKPGAHIAVSEFLTDPDYPLKSTTKARLEQAGFEIVDAEGVFWTYTVRGRKPA